MAEKSKKSAKKATAKKPTQTVRERSSQQSEAKPKKRVVQRTATGISKPFKAIGRFIAKIARPFRFLLWPFKTKPLRFIGRVLYKILFIGYFKNSWKELREVTWPGRKETWQLTFAVFVFAIVFGLLVTVIDLGLVKLFRDVLLKG